MYRLYIFHQNLSPKKNLGGSPHPRDSHSACNQSCTTYAKKTLEMEVNKARSLRHPPSCHTIQNRLHTGGGGCAGTSKLVDVTSEK